MNSQYRLLKAAAALVVVGQLAISAPAEAQALDLYNVPLYISSNVAPLVILDITKDQQLHYKAYNDYTDLNGNGALDAAEATYMHSNTYYGYFDPVKCYDYSTASSLFVPTGISPGNNKFCDTAPGGGRWSGNFLNWATMARIDLVRKLLYGGKRSSDSAILTVLERNFVPTEAHAWAKYYSGSDIDRLTPYTLAAAAALPATGATRTAGPPVSYSGNPSVSIGTGSKSFRNVGISVCRGDQVKVNLGAATTTNYMIGFVTSVNGTNADCSTASTASGGFTMSVTTVAGAGTNGSGSSSANGAWTVTNLSSTGISMCNVTAGATAGVNRISQTNTNPPLLRVARGNFGFWASNERFQCLWNPANASRTPTGNGGNGNEGTLSGSKTLLAGSPNWASALEPLQATHSLGYPAAGPFTTFDLVVRVQACVSSALIGTEKCKQYGSSLKPVGLLQVYGDTNLIHFGMMTGSYQKNKSGGVLRKNVVSFNDEVNLTDGTFKAPPVAGNIVDTLNRMRLYGYDYNVGQYTGVGSPNDQCDIVTSGSGTAAINRADFAEGRCGSWGNPMSEIFLESLRYFANSGGGSPLAPTPAFTYISAGSKDGALGLPLANWTSPVSSNNYCAPMNTLLFNASVMSFDTDQFSNITDLGVPGGTTAQSLTNTVGGSTNENINGSSRFVGTLAGAGDRTCTGKTVANFADAQGICPEAATLQGGYQMSGLAHYAHTNKIRPDLASLVPANDTQSLKVNTYSVSLAPAVPKITIPVGANSVTILPAWRAQDVVAGFSNGGLVDFRVIELTATTGKYYANWEVSSQGADYDSDAWGTISYSVNAGTNQITITTDLIFQAASGANGFGYIVGGTTQDGAHFHSGMNNFNYSFSGTPECTNCNLGDAPTSRTYTVGGSSASLLNDPLWYAAKYGGFRDTNNNNRPDQSVEWDRIVNSTGADGSDNIPDNYFLVTNPNQLETALDRTFVTILGTSSASSVATNSTSLNTGSRIFQARFNSSDWSGQLLSFPIDLNGIISTVPDWDAGVRINSQTFVSRTILTYNPDLAVHDGIPFQWANVSANATLAAELNKNASGVTDSRGSQRVDYLRGDSSQEGDAATNFRKRAATKLGDIIDSNPQFVGAPNASHSDVSYADFKSQFAGRNPVIYVGANDGMLHGFDGTAGASGGQERIGYVPSRSYYELPKLTSQNYVHRYYVDGTPNVVDTCKVTVSPATNPCPTTTPTYGNWWSTLVGGLAGGGQGIFALDVTDPTTFTEGNAANLVLWEFDDRHDADLGYTYGQPQIGKMANGKWAVVFGNGFNNTYSCASRPCPNIGPIEGTIDTNSSSTGHGVLFILFIEEGLDGDWILGTDYIKLDTQVGTTLAPNGLSQPALFDENGDGVIDYIYVGDIEGNLWKWDVTASSPAAWNPAFGTPASPTPLFVAQDSSSNRQPITSAPVVFSPHPQGGYMVEFGTGQYLQQADPSNYSQQTVYGIWDRHTPSNPSASEVSGRSELQSQAVVAKVTDAGGEFRVMSDNAVDYTSGTPQRGWYVDFPNDDGLGNPVYGSGTATGERVVFRPLVDQFKFTVTTLIPSVVLCSSGGTSWTMDLEPLTGGRLIFSPFDVNADLEFSNADKVDIGGGVMVYVSGRKSTVGITPTPTVIQGGAGKEFKVMSGSTGGLESVLENPGVGGGGGGAVITRRAWREILRE